MSDNRTGVSSATLVTEESSGRDAAFLDARKRLMNEIKFSWKEVGWLTLVFSAVAASIAALIWIDLFKDDPTGSSEFLIGVVGALFACPIVAIGAHWYTVQLRRLFVGMRASSIGVADATEKASRLQDNLNVDFVTNLVKINFKYIDQYYLQTQQQADRSFSLSMWVSVAGFIIIAVGIIIGLFREGMSAYITTSAGVLSEFIAAIFFYLYNKTISSMGSYHRKLVITQNIALALKISEELPVEARTPVQVELVKTLTKDVNDLLIMESRDWRSEKGKANI